MSTIRNRGRIKVRKSLRKPNNKIILTPEGVDLLTQIATNYHLSKSELVEYLARGSLAVVNPAAKLTINLGESNQVIQKETVSSETNELLEKRLEEKDEQIRELQQHQNYQEIKSDSCLQLKIEELEQEVLIKQEQIEKLEKEFSQLEAEEEEIIKPEIDWLAITALLLALTMILALFISHYYFGAITPS